MGVLVHPKDHHFNMAGSAMLSSMGPQLSAEELVTPIKKQQQPNEFGKISLQIEKQNNEVKSAMKRFNELDACPTEKKFPVAKASGASKDGPKSTRLDFEQILELLLLSRGNVFQETIPLQKCASPVPYNNDAETFHSMFYVVKSDDIECRTVSSSDGFQGIPVRYQGFTKCIVWFSKERPQYGIVARRMQHQKRMKQKGQHTDYNAANKSSQFFQVYEGFSYVLIERPDVSSELSKASVSNYIVKDASKFVQIWPLGCEFRGGAPSSSMQHLEQRQRRHTAFGQPQYMQQQQPVAPQQPQQRRPRTLLRRRSKSLSALDERTIKRENNGEASIFKQEAEKDDGFVDLMCEYFEIESKSSSGSEYMQNQCYAPGEEVPPMYPARQTSYDLEFQPDRLDVEDFEKFFDEWRL